jgi:hypothetical protein
MNSIMKLLSQVLISQVLALNLNDFEIICTNNTMGLVCDGTACVTCQIKFDTHGINNKEQEHKEQEHKEQEHKEQEHKEQEHKEQEKPENTGTSKQIRVNAAAPSSLGSLDCLDKKGQAFVDKQNGIDFKTTHFCGAPRGPDGVACGEILTLNMGGRSTFCEVVFNAEDPAPGNWAYVEIYKKPYEELTGKSIVNDILFETGYFMAECKGSCF